MNIFIQKFSFFAVSLFFLINGISAQPPSGYYDSAEGLYEEALRASLHNIIDNHNVRSYSQLWSDFELTDKKPNGKVWDMYSDQPGGTPAYEYTFFSDQCGNYSGEGSCYNREHSWPKSWFGDASPMYTDLFHLIPTDGYVNGRRSNYPFGEVGSASWTSTNGSKVGSNNTPGYGGTVFEPIDAYKGDLARGILYMTVRYYGEDSNWPGSAMTDGADLLPWAISLMLQWHEQDPVSQKEIDRNNDIYQIQQNRNPFVDHPEFAQQIYDPTASLSDNSQKKSIHIYPNPATASGHINLQWQSNTSVDELVLTDIHGRIVLKEMVNPAQQQTQLKLNNIEPGFYMILLFENQQQIAISKLLLN
ncbi:MAG: endonuclease [Bacteroidetes bacterium]|nr:endonuclease [Bacteroidota bacterium]MBU1578187.1 endonuclease [Bacteroidota bacterium]MBU2557245.1 endonuclease [Bacteroidota bacterium]